MTILYDFLPQRKPRMTKDRVLDMVQGNIRDARLNLWDAQPFEGSAYIERRLCEIFDQCERLKDHVPTDDAE